MYNNGLPPRQPPIQATPAQPAVPAYARSLPAVAQAPLAQPAVQSPYGPPNPNRALTYAMPQRHPMPGGPMMAGPGPNPPTGGYRPPAPAVAPAQPIPIFDPEAQRRAQFGVR